jgi:[NiFe] hydrogenase diaphorase moiety large subunit
VDRCSCTGLCDQGPALLVDHHQVVTRLDAARVDELAELLLADVPPADWPADWFVVHDNIQRADVLLQGLSADAPDLSTVLARDPAQLLAEIDRSGLRGRGGAGFPTARKWRACAEADAPDGQRCVVCNADEGEPGTFKDRVLLSRHADELFDGMTVAARAIGAQTGLVYLRGEYRFLLPHLASVLERRRAQGLLGRDVGGVAGFDFDIAIHLGAGAFRAEKIDQARARLVEARDNQRKLTHSITAGEAVELLVQGAQFDVEVGRDDSSDYWCVY